MFKKYILTTLVLLLAGCVTFAQASNSILNTTVRKTAENKLNLTFFTKGENVEKPIVKDKGNNQYVILLPNLVDNAGRKPDLRNASDIVSDVSVKTINEGAVTYTKVSITTKKPVTINAETRRTSQSASDLTGVNDILTKVNLISQDIQASKEIQPVNTVTALPKMNSVQDILNNKNSIGTVKPAVDVKKEIPAPVVAAPIKTVSAHVPPNTSAIKADAKKLKNENIKNVRKNAVENINKIEKNIKSSVENNVTVNDEEPETILPPVNNEAEASIQEIVPESKTFSASKALASPIALIMLFVFGVALLAMFIIGKMKSALADSDELNESFIQRMNSAAVSEKKDLTGLAQNTELNWQEKYQSLKGEEKAKQKAVVEAHAGIVEPDDDLDIIEDYTEEEEELPQIIEPLNPFAAPVVKDSADSITSSMKRSLKIADEPEINLAQTKRNTGLKNRFKGFESNPISGLERNMNELLDAVIKMEEEKPVVQPAPVIVESVVEPEPVVEVHEEAPVVHEIVEHASLPIQKPKKKMKIKQSRAIDDNKGFYLVDMEDKLALMGRINDKFTVLKKFDDKDKATLQVRRDKDNLYMVRTDGFKALVDVADTKMGVLAEL
ncbi:MAG: hypothetical protein NC390_00870 [Fusobacterium sp.]|nr:hypothetical protein [Fusobacterium sp.]